MRAKVHLAVVPILLMPIGGALAHPVATCPLSTLSCSSVQTYSSTSGSCFGPYDNSYASFDAVSGVVSGSGISYLSTDGGYGSAQTDDEFSVVGPAPGMPLVFTAQLILYGQACRGFDYGRVSGSASAFLKDASGATDELSIGGNPLGGCNYAEGDTLRLVIQNNVGDSFYLTYYAAGGGYEGARGTMGGTLRFMGLPQGASVVSCRGFSQDSPTATQTSTWGRVKGLYR